MSGPVRAVRLEAGWGGDGLVAELADDDVSLTYDATVGVVTRHAAGRSEPVGDDVFEVLAAAVAAEAGDPDVTWVGYLGYACRRDLPARPAVGVPDAVWLRVRSAPPGERCSRSRHAVLPVGEAAPVEPVEPVPDWYAEAFARVQEHLHAGDSYEVNLTYREVVDSDVDPATAYARLVAGTTPPYAGMLRHGDTHLLCASPERYAAIDADGWLEARPIKGTTPRGATAAEDAAQAERLRTDPKLRAENLMITDLLRHDLSGVCRVGTVGVPELMVVEPHPAVHQLVTTVRGRLREDVGTVAALETLFPAGSMTGAPKRRTMQVVDEVEATPRGAYAGAFGWVCGDGRADLAVVIRSLTRGPTHDTAGPAARWELGTGGGITVLSTPGEEWAESRWKAARARAALVPPGA